MAGREDNGKVGIIGYCSGGRQAYLAACSLRGVDAAIDCYGGGVVAKPEELTPRQPVAPIELTKDLQCPSLGLFGVEDSRPSPEDVAKTEDALKKFGKTYEFHTYENAGTRSSPSTVRSIACTRRWTAGRSSSPGSRSTSNDRAICDDRATTVRTHRSPEHGDLLWGGAALARASQADADRTLDLLLQYGVNHIDTAARYGDSELRIGPWMARHGKDFFLEDRQSDGVRGA